MTRTPAIHHISLSVLNLDKSGKWYQDLLGPAEVFNREGEGWVRLRMNWPNGLVISLTEHSASAVSQRFDHTQVGLDHIGFRCDSEAEVRDWVTRLDELGMEHGPVENVSYGWAVTARDPDGIPIEFFCPK